MGVHRSVERSAVFRICIAGCLIDGQRECTFLLCMLGRRRQGSVGNVEEVGRLMRRVWRHRDRERAHDKFAPVDWHDVMRKGDRIHLVWARPP